MIGKTNQSPAAGAQQPTGLLGARASCPRELPKAQAFSGIESGVSGILSTPRKSGRGLPHSKTCGIPGTPMKARQRLGVRQSSAAFAYCLVADGFCCQAGRKAVWRSCAIALTLGVFLGFPKPILAANALPQGEVLETEGHVELNKPNAAWVPARPGLALMVQDRLRTLALSRATLQLAELGKLRVDQLTTLEILPPKTSASKATLDFKAGAAYFFTRGKPREFLLQTPYGIGASRGTEFLVTIESDRALISVFDGQVEFTNALGSILLTNGEQGLAAAGQPPVKTAVIQATNIVQWWLYYPGVLDPDELSLPAADQTTLAPSLTAYRAGDLLGALQAYPAGRTPATDADRVYYAALLLSVGQVEKSESLLAVVSPISPNARLAAALRQVIGVVSSRSSSSSSSSSSSNLLATELLARSYAQQPTNLTAALQSALMAVKKSPNFAFGWERVAELEFSFGRLDRTEAALAKALAFAPRNPQALALQGFVLAGKNHIREAFWSFSEAIEIDGALGNAWLGRGLCRIHQGDDLGGRSDLQTAAALEPNRALLHSYLGKAFANVCDDSRANKELALSERLDPNDPTPWLYSGLLNEQENRLNQAVEDLEKSLDLNDNRQVYRSRLLLDQDRAVRSASLAAIYQKDGLSEVSLREAARAVTADYGNYSSHLFLANSFDALRDPTLFNLRYETAWFNELLLANMLAPIGAGALSQNISQQEYARLFEADRLGFITDSSYRSDHQFHELASQYGTVGDTSYAFDLEFRHNDGVRPNNALSIVDFHTTFKQQLSPKDSVLLLVDYLDYHSGDNFQYYDPKDPNNGLRPHYQLDETQLPPLLVAYHREWGPGIHTLFLAGRLVDDQHISDQKEYELELIQPSANVALVNSLPFDLEYHSDLEIYSAELMQIFQGERQTLLLGGRFQDGQFHTRARLTLNESESGFTNSFLNPPAAEDVRNDMQRATVYGYYTLELPMHLYLTGGAAYDHLTYPLNFRQAPIVEAEATRSQLGPKVALTWSPLPELTLRGAYTRSLGGVSLDQSVRLEPTELAGFLQSFRTIIPESVGGGSVSAPAFETFGAAIDLKLHTRTYIGLEAQLLKSDLQRQVGAFVVTTQFPYLPSSTPEQLNYDEFSASVTIDQLLSQEWVVGARYRYSRARLQEDFLQIPANAFKPNNPYLPNDDIPVSELHTPSAYLLFNHPSGFFARAELNWYLQYNSVRTSIYTSYPNTARVTVEKPGDEFPQLNFFVGYRFLHQFGDLTFGLLNATGGDYHLNPLNVYTELPHSRVWSVRLRISI
ncbi:MAG: hypothetical protein C5B50_27815 [Verrucomicrobia bacterium]|nr:MAG: hypothetical protein C5B50_27815 [Verrucomicrobiota bacterium]